MPYIARYNSALQCFACTAVERYLHLHASGCRVGGCHSSSSHAWPATRVGFTTHPGKETKEQQQTNVDVISGNVISPEVGRKWKNTKKYNNNKDVLRHGYTPPYVVSWKTLTRKVYFQTEFVKLQYMELFGPHNCHTCWPGIRLIMYRLKSSHGLLDLWGPENGTV